VWVRIDGCTEVGRALRRSDDCSNHSSLVGKYGIATVGYAGVAGGEVGWSEVKVDVGGFRG
jgi:hypothetical protein